MAWLRWIATTALVGVSMVSFGACGRSNDVVGGTEPIVARADNSGDGGDILNFTPCAELSEEAEVLPVNMYILVDKSGSMDDPANPDEPQGATKWEATEAAFNEFFAAPEAAALRVALRFWPDNGCEDLAPDDRNNNDTTCDSTPCSQPEVELGPLADVEQQMALTAAFAGQEPDGPTPMSAALEGGVTWANGIVEETGGNERVVVLLVSDGLPNGCIETDEDAIVSIPQAAAAGSNIFTYAVGLAGSSEELMNRIGAAGGTNEGIFIGTGNAQADLLQALLAIAGDSVQCSFPVPQPAEGEVLDPRLVRLEYTPNGEGEAQILRRVTNSANCTENAGWYYDDNGSPNTITLCGGQCGTIQADENAELAFAIGCECETDPDCPEGTVCEDNRCIDACVTDEDCEGALVCRAGRCVPPPGQPCELDLDCPFPQICVNNQCTSEGVYVGVQEAVQGGAFNCRFAPGDHRRTRGTNGVWLLMAIAFLLRRRR